MRRFVLALLVLAALSALVVTVSASGGTPRAVVGSPHAAGAQPPIQHVFVIVLENESASTTFPASGSGPAPYLSDTMRSQGAYLPNYYATGHNSNDNYISMISGQAPNLQNEADCQLFDNFTNGSNTGAPYYQQKGSGCVYPADIQTLAGQLESAGYSWRSYNQSMGNDPSREAGACGHPTVGSIDNTQQETAQDAYATRHNPFVYFHSIIDDTAGCDSHVVNLDALGQDLANPDTTPTYSFITPDLCGDGHDASCSDKSRPGGFQGINQFLSKYVPMIENSPAFKQQNGLLLTTFDEADTSDKSNCCGEIAGPGASSLTGSGDGGGRIGTVAISPCIKPGTVDQTAYNHYSMLGSVENLFGLAHLGYAALPGQSYFGSDLFNAQCSGSSGSSPPGSGSAGSPRPPSSGAPSGSAGPARLTLDQPKLKLSGETTGRAPVGTLTLHASQKDARFTVAVRHNQRGAWRTLEAKISNHTYRFQLHSGVTYEFRAKASNPAGALTGWRQTSPVVVPTLARPAGTRLRGHWRGASERGALRGRVLIGTRGSS
ncbi:MAG: hypothetical protein J2O48_09990, partial [Solirubrobacterales bacterium]|nr:hypothetical protein [Solirubrobacterales bacterium]